MNSCDKAATICDKAQYGEATLIEKIKLRFHLLICKTCATHSQKNTKLTSLCQKANLRVLSDQEKSKIKQELQNKL